MAQTGFGFGAGVSWGNQRNIGGEYRGDARSLWCRVWVAVQVAGPVNTCVTRLQTGSGELKLGEGEMQ